VTLTPVTALAAFRLHAPRDSRCPRDPRDRGGRASSRVGRRFARRVRREAQRFGGALEYAASARKCAAKRSGVDAAGRECASGAASGRHDVVDRGRRRRARGAHAARARCTLARVLYAGRRWRPRHRAAASVGPQRARDVRARRRRRAGRDRARSAQSRGDRPVEARAP
jgi:hypothetical protein